MRYIRENNTRKNLEVEIEELRKENLNVANNYAQYRQEHACYLKRNLQLSQ